MLTTIIIGAAVKSDVIVWTVAAENMVYNDQIVMAHCQRNAAWKIVYQEINYLDKVVEEEAMSTRNTIKNEDDDDFEDFEDQWQSESLVEVGRRRNGSKETKIVMY